MNIVFFRSFKILRKPPQLILHHWIVAFLDNWTKPISQRFHKVSKITKKKPIHHYFFKRPSKSIHEKKVWDGNHENCSLWYRKHKNQTAFYQKFDCSKRFLLVNPFWIKKNDKKRSTLQISFLNKKCQKKRDFFRIFRDVLKIWRLSKSITSNCDGTRLAGYEFLF